MAAEPGGGRQGKRLAAWIVLSTPSATATTSNVSSTYLPDWPSPRWHDGRLWFSDWGAHEVIALDPAGQSQVVASVTSCIAFLPDGRLLLVSGAHRQVLCLEPDGTLAVHADLNVLSEHPWNDIAVDGHGNAYVNNLGFEFPGGEFAPGLIALISPEGSVRQVADGLAFPNGMAVTPDDSTLIVAESYGNRLTAYHLDAEGGLSDRRTWAELGTGVPDGICLDAEGAVWYADVPNQVCVRVREGGKILQTISLDRGGFACALGGADGRTLFVTAQQWGGTATMFGGERTGQIQAFTVDVPGVGRP